MKDKTNKPLSEMLKECERCKEYPQVTIFIKQAIKRLKEELKEFDYKGLRLEGTYLKLKNKIDKIFGDELTK